MLKDQNMRSQIMPPKLALNSCCSLKCNAFILCIPTRAGCLGDTQCKNIRDENGGRNDDDGNMGGWRCIAVLVCNEERDREHKKQVADELEEMRHCYSTYKYCSGHVHQRVQNTKNTANMHRQWKLTDNSQNRVAWRSHGTAHRPVTPLTVSLLKRSSMPHI